MIGIITSIIVNLTRVFLPFIFTRKYKFKKKKKKKNLKQFQNNLMLQLTKNILNFTIFKIQISL